MNLPPFDLDCCICGDAYGTRFVCAPCRSDPANADWVEGQEVIVASVERASDPTPWGERQQPWRPSAKFRRVVCLLVYSRGSSLRDVATRAKCSLAYVQKVRDQVTKPAGLKRDLEISTPKCTPRQAHRV